MGGVCLKTDDTFDAFDLCDETDIQGDILMRTVDGHGSSKASLKWLFVTAEFPWPMNHGTWLRVYHLVRSLRAGGDSVSILSHGEDEVGEAAYASAGVRVLDGPIGMVPHRGKARCNFSPYVYDADLARAISAQAGDYDVVVLVRPCMLQYGVEASKAGCVIADMVDDPILEEGRLWWMERSLFRLFRRIRFLVGERLCEKKYLDKIDISTFVSEQDSQSFLKRQPKVRSTWVPNGVDVSYYERPEDQVEFDDVPVVSFVGNMIHPPNELAALYLLRKIAPLVWKAEPETRFQIIGSHPSSKLLSLAGPKVEITGWVDDIRPRLWDSRVVVLPMQTGTGIKNKLLEAWAAGLAVVATPLAVQGVPVRDGENVLIGSSASELAEMSVRVIRDAKLENRLAMAGQRTVREQLSWPIVANQFRSVAMKNLALQRS